MKRYAAWIVTAVAFGAAIGVDIAMDSSYLPGYWASIGLVGCAIIVVVSKWLGKAFIQRPEDHWPLDVPADEQEDLRG